MRAPGARELLQDPLAKKQPRNRRAAGPGGLRRLRSQAASQPLALQRGCVGPPQLKVRGPHRPPRRPGMHRAGGGSGCPDVDQNGCNPTLRQPARARETGARAARGSVTFWRGTFTGNGKRAGRQPANGREDFGRGLEPGQLGKELMDRGRLAV